MNEILECLDKDALIKELTDKCFDKNFGTLSKSEFDLILFKHYLAAANQYVTDSNGAVNTNKISDYKLGFALGVTPTRVRNLRLKVSLTNKQEANWRSELIKVLENRNNIKFSGDYFQIVVRDKNLFFAIEDWLEDRGNTADITLNPKQLRVEKRAFYDLLKELKMIDDESSKSIISKLQKSLKFDAVKNNIVECGISLVKDALNPTETIEKIVVDLPKNAVRVFENILYAVNEIKK